MRVLLNEHNFDLPHLKVAVGNKLYRASARGLGPCEKHAQLDNSSVVLDYSKCSIGFEAEVPVDFCLGSVGNFFVK